jgi:outer membrane protein assembly factor BamB
VLAFDLETGTELWRSYPLADNAEWTAHGNIPCNFCLEEDTLWVPFHYGDTYYLLKINAIDGSKVETIAVGNGSEGVHFGGFGIAACGPKVFYFCSSLHYCDTTSLTTLDASKNLFQGETQEAYPFTDKKTVGLLFYDYDEDFIFSYRNTEDYSNCGLIRFNPTSMQKVWEIQGEYCQINYTVNNGKILSTSISYTNPGEEVERFVAYDVNTGAYIGKYESGIFGDTYPLCVDNKIIQTSDVNLTDSGKPMVYCLNADTLKLIWKKDVNLKNQSSGSNCQSNNGIVYYPRSSGMWLYDLETGKTLGKDESIEASDPFDSAFSFRYGNLLIIQNGDELLGIKMNFKQGASGLIKE